MKPAKVVERGRYAIPARIVVPYHCAATTAQHSKALQRIVDNVFVGV